MSTDAVLVLGTDDNKELIELIFNAGLAPVVRKTMRGVLAKLPTERFTAILVDRDHSNDDLLEFVLNVRDIDIEIPVFIVGEPADPKSDEMLTRLRNIHFI
ncbi:MAG: hypothetical protein HQ592_09195 [Planctomycetes bacterium]|nr:hypothetical protein [Planctomycetota bacterium]